LQQSSPCNTSAWFLQNSMNNNLWWDISIIAVSKVNFLSNIYKHIHSKWCETSVLLSFLSSISVSINPYIANMSLTLNKTVIFCTLHQHYSITILYIYHNITMKTTHIIIFLTSHITHLTSHHVIYMRIYIHRKWYGLIIMHGRPTPSSVWLSPPCHITHF
jgi:hypothetical protein